MSVNRVGVTWIGIDLCQLCMYRRIDCYLILVTNPRLQTFNTPDRQPPTPNNPPLTPNNTPTIPNNLSTQPNHLIPYHNTTVNNTNHLTHPSRTPINNNNNNIITPPKILPPQHLTPSHIHHTPSTIIHMHSHKLPNKSTTSKHHKNPTSLSCKPQCPHMPNQTGITREPD